MRPLSALSLSIGIGLLGAGASLWSPTAPLDAAADENFQGFFAGEPWTPWEGAHARAIRESEPLFIVAVTGSAGCVDVVRRIDSAAGIGTPLRAALAPYVVTLLRIDGPAPERDAAAALGLDRGPLCVIAEAQPGSTVVTDGLPCITGAVPEPFGLTLALMGAGAEQTDVLAMVRRQRAMGRDGEAQELLADALAKEPSINGRLHRFARLEDAFRRAPLAEREESTNDAEGPVERELLLNDDKDVLFVGWSALASTFERRARAAADSPSGEHLGVPRKRWERRLRDATRRAWIGCPDEAVPAYGSLLLSRYLRAPADLDSLDRAFLGAVVRSMGKHIESGGPLTKWLDTAKASLESLR